MLHKERPTHSWRSHGTVIVVAGTIIIVTGTVIVVAGTVVVVTATVIIVARGVVVVARGVVVVRGVVVARGVIVICRVVVICCDVIFGWDTDSLSWITDVTRVALLIDVTGDSLALQPLPTRQQTYSADGHHQKHKLQAVEVLEIHH